MTEESGAAVREPDDPVASPCVGVCELDQVSKLCMGCLRTADEIAMWRDAGAEVRRSILERVRRRWERNTSSKRNHHCYSKSLAKTR